MKTIPECPTPNCNSYTMVEVEPYSDDWRCPRCQRVYHIRTGDNERVERQRKTF